MISTLKCNLQMTAERHTHAGAMDAKMPVGGIRISREAGTTVRTASYLPTDCAVFCRFLSSRKVLSCTSRQFTLVVCGM